MRDEVAAHLDRHGIGAETIECHALPDSSPLTDDEALKEGATLPAGREPRSDEAIGDVLSRPIATGCSRPPAFHLGRGQRADMGGQLVGGRREDTGGERCADGGDSGENEGQDKGAPTHTVIVQRRRSPTAPEVRETPVTHD